MQFAATYAKHCIASGRFSKNFHIIAAFFNGVHLDCVDIDVDVGSTFEMDSLGFIPQLYIETGNYCVHNYFTLFGGTSECGKCHHLAAAAIDNDTKNNFSIFFCLSFSSSRV